MKRVRLPVLLAAILLLCTAAPLATAADDSDVDIGALLNNAANRGDWKVTGQKVERSEDGYARISGADTIVGYTGRKIEDETVKMRFRCTLDSTSGWVALMLRSDDPNKALWTARHTYGLLLRSSSVELQRWNDGVCTSLALVSCPISEDAILSLRFSACNTDGATELSVVINNEEMIRVTDSNPIAESGYFSIMISDQNAIDIFADSDAPVAVSTVPLVYLTGCFEEAGNRLIHWRYNGAYTNFTGVAVSGEDGEILAILDYPADRYTLPASYSADRIYITPLTANGVQRERLEIDTIPQKTASAVSGRIAVQRSDAGAYFYNAETGVPFVPCGANYIRLRGDVHSSFEAETAAGPADYDPYDAEAALKLMANNGMNTVRVFLFGGTPETPGIAGSLYGIGPYAPYLDNVADFIERANRNGIYVLLTFGCELPETYYYRNRLADLPVSRNTMYLTQEGIDAYTAVVCDTLNDLKKIDPNLLAGLLGVQLQNEVALYTNEWPFDDAHRSETVTGADGLAYDMSVDADRQALADNGLRFYIDALTNAVRQIDPALLVSESAFSCYDVGTTPEGSYGMHSCIEDARIPPTAEVLLNTDLDFLDFHFYHTDPGLTPEESFMARYDSMLLGSLSTAAQEARTSKPIIMGEFGSLKFIDNSVSKELDTLRGLRVKALEKGLRGVIYWTLDCFEQEALGNLCESPELLAELANFDIPLPAVKIKAQLPAEPVAVEKAVSELPVTEEVGSGAGAVSPWVLAAAGGALLSCAVASAILLRRKQKKKARNADVK